MGVIDSELAELARLPTAARLTAHFYSWEQWGRGWQIWPGQVTVEPPFKAFRGHWAPPVGTTAMADDGRKPTLLSSFFDSIATLASPRRPNGAEFQQWAAELLDLPTPEIEWEDPQNVTLTVMLPQDAKISAELSEQFLVSLGACSRPVAFEVISSGATITLQIAADAREINTVREQLKAHLPEAVLDSDDSDALPAAWDAASGGNEIVVDFGLGEEFMRPIRLFSRFESVDPFMGLVGALSDLSSGDCGVFQVLFTPARAPWADSVIRAVTDGAGDGFFENDPDMLRLARAKITRPLFGVVVRVAARGGRSDEIARRLTGAVRQFSEPSSNELIPLNNDGYDDQHHVQDLLDRRTRRSGMILNSEELVSLVHLPSSAVQSERLARQVHRTKAAPVSAGQQAYILGENVANGRTVPVGLSLEQRIRHMHLIGASGTGKSTLLLNLITQDLDRDMGFAVMDPHGDLIDEVLTRVPERRIDDVILLDAADAEYPIGMNLLQAHSETEKMLLSSDLVAGFRRLSTSWGDQMTSVLSNAVLAFLESDRGGTLLELRRFLVEPEFRRDFLASVRDPEVVYYWQKEFPLLQGRPQGSILTRLDTFLRSKLVRNIVSQKDSKLDLGQVMNQGKVLLIKLAQGAVGEENVSLLGTLFISKFHQITLGRQEQKEQDRRPFFLYVDEFHNFITPSMASILSGARKYRFGLVLAHQELRQLMRDADVASAVLSNAATRICFRVGDSDAEKLAEGFVAFSAEDLTNLATGQAVCRIERSQQDFTLETNPTIAVEPELAHMRQTKIVEHSRTLYGRAPHQTPAVVGMPAVPRRQSSRTAAVPVVLPTAAAVPSTPSLGRGGPQHQYLQQLVKRWAEDRGYRVTIEKSVLDGLGSVDVVLSRDGERVAIEICVTTSIEHELENIHKCIAAGFERVVLLTADECMVRRARQALSAQLGAEQMARIHIAVPEELFALLQRDGQGAPKDQSTVKGYKVKISRATVSAESNRIRQFIVAQTLLGIRNIPRSTREGGRHTV